MYPWILIKVYMYFKKIAYYHINNMNSTIYYDYYNIINTALLYSIFEYFSFIWD